MLTLILIDTAGRLQTQINLMEQLKKFIELLIKKMKMLLIIEF